MRVLLVGKDDGPGGAQRVSRDLLEGLRRAGHTAWLAVDRQLSNQDGVLPIPQHRHRGAWARAWQALGDAAAPVAGSPRNTQLVHNLLALGVGQPSRALGRLRGHEDHAFPATHHLLDLPPSFPDILHLHNLHENFFDLRALPSLSARVPTFITLHDAWLFTGHCAQPMGCARFETGCGQCPDLHRYPSLRRDGTRRNLALKARAFAASRLHVVAPSPFMLELASRSVLARGMATSHVVPNAADTRVFRPGDRQAARAALEIPQDVDVLVSVSLASRRNPYKDPHTALETARVLAGAPRQRPLWVLGLGTDAPTLDLGSVKVISRGLVTQPAQMARFYQAANAFLHTARGDNAPLVALESLCCATPVVTSDVGGVGQLLQHARDAGLPTRSFLAPAGDAARHAAGVESALAEPRQVPPEAALHRVGLETFVARHVELYQRALQDWVRPRAPRTAS
jgi:glycosyltransferase involved in cell wall biosynthesis